MRKACSYPSAISILKTYGLGEPRVLVVHTGPDICGLLLEGYDGFWSFSSES